MTSALFYAYLEDLEKDSIIKLSNFSKIPKKGSSETFGEIVCDYSEDGMKVSEIMEWIKDNCDGNENPIKVNIMFSTAVLHRFGTQDGEVTDMQFQLSPEFLVKHD